jgi:hypothetical protein
MKDKQLLSWGLGAGIVALVVFILGYAFLWSADGRNGNARGNNGSMADMMNGNWNGDSNGCGGMMGGSGQGMMGGSGQGMMGNGQGMMGNGQGMMGGGMMGGPTASIGTPVSIDQAADTARRQLESLGNTDLQVTQVQEFANGFLARVTEKSTKANAFVLNIDRNTGAVSREAGPDLAWNTKYGGSGMMGGQGMMGGCMQGMMGGSGMMDGSGMDESMDDMMDDMDDMGDMGSMHGTSGSAGMMGSRSMMNRTTSSTTTARRTVFTQGMMGNGQGMMGNGQGQGMMGNGTTGSTTATTDMPIKQPEAKDRAQKYLDREYPGAKAGDPAIFYGYYTAVVEKDGRTFGLLSINGTDGQAWWHSWLGPFIAAKNY